MSTPAASQVTLVEQVRTGHFWEGYLRTREFGFLGVKVRRAPGFAGPFLSRSPWKISVMPPSQPVHRPDRIPAPPSFQFLLSGIQENIQFHDDFLQPFRIPLRRGSETQSFPAFRLSRHQITSSWLSLGVPFGCQRRTAGFIAFKNKIYCMFGRLLRSPNPTGHSTFVSFSGTEVPFSRSLPELNLLVSSSGGGLPGRLELERVQGAFKFLGRICRCRKHSEIKNLPVRPVPTRELAGRS